MSAYSLDLREKKIVELVKKGIPKAETARRFGVDRATLKRYSASSSRRAWHLRAKHKAPGKRPKLDQ
jgi:transposase